MDVKELLRQIEDGKDDNLMAAEQFRDLLNHMLADKPRQRTLEALREQYGEDSPGYVYALGVLDGYREIALRFLQILLHKGDGFGPLDEYQ